MWRARVLAASVALVTAAGCASSQPRPAAPTRGQVANHLTDAYVQYARCAREHGMPELPDPQVDDHGDDHYPAGSIPAGGWPQSVLQGCQAAWGTVLQWRNQLDSLQNPRTSQPASTARMLRLAQCIRAHGFPDYPDPGADGQTQAPVPPGFDKPDLSPAARAAIQACQSASP